MVQLGMVSYKDMKANKKMPFLTIGPDKSAQVTILKELHELKPQVEHSNPESWYKTALCTYESGYCYACEQQLRGWNQKIKIYIPVIHRDTLKVFQTGMGKNSVLHSLQDYFREHGTVKDTQFVISRNGNGKRSKYFATPVDGSEPVVYNGTIRLSKMFNSVEYDKQAEYYKN